MAIQVHTWKVRKEIVSFKKKKSSHEEKELRATLRRKTSGHWISMSQQCVLPAQKANCINGSVTSRLREIILFLYSALVRPYLEYCVRLWGSRCNKDMNQFQQIQREDDKRTGALIFWRQVSKVGIVQSREKNALQRIHCGFSVPTGKMRRDSSWRNIVIGQGIRALS